MTVQLSWQKGLQLAWVVFKASLWALVMHDTVTFEVGNE